MALPPPVVHSGSLHGAAEALQESDALLYEKDVFYPYI
jgi:hypothetical protein